MEIEFASVLVEERVSCAGGVVCLQLRKAITSEKIEFFKKIFDREIQKGTNKLILDLGLLEVIYSVHLGNLVFYCKRLRSLGGDLALCCLNSQIQAIIDRTGLNQMIRSFQTREDAISGLKN